jgi:hypothetical protein
MLPPTPLQEYNTSNQRQPEVNLSRQPVKEDITIVINMARGKTNAVTISMAPSKWLLFKEAQGLRAEARSAKATNSARTSTPLR